MITKQQVVATAIGIATEDKLRSNDGECVYTRGPANVPHCAVGVTLDRLGIANALYTFSDDSSGYEFGNEAVDTERFAFEAAGFTQDAIDFLAEWQTLADCGDGRTPWWDALRELGVV